MHLPTSLKWSLQALLYYFLHLIVALSAHICSSLPTFRSFSIYGYFVWEANRHILIRFRASSSSICNSCPFNNLSKSFEVCYCWGTILCLEAPTLIVISNYFQAYGSRKRYFILFLKNYYDWDFSEWWIYSQAINIEGLALDKFIEHHVTNSNWAVEKNQNKGQFIIFPHNEFNNPELKKSAGDGIPLEHITRILPILGWSLLWGYSIWWWWIRIKFWSLLWWMHACVYLVEALYMLRSKSVKFVA